MKEVKMLKDAQGRKKGKVYLVTDRAAAEFAKKGLAQYKTEKEEKVHIETKEDKEPKSTKEIKTVKAK
jgi:hypothetical protein